MSVCGILMMHRTRKYQRNVRGMLFVQEIGIFGKSLIALIGDVNEIGVSGER